MGIDSLTKLGFGWSWAVGSVFGVGATTWIIDFEVDMWMDEVEGLVVIGAPKLKNEVPQAIHFSKQINPSC